jgi:hypothetical protein
MDWSKLEKEVKLQSLELSEMTRERTNLSRHYNKLVDLRSKLRKEYNISMSKAQELKTNLFKLHKEVSDIKKEWIASGGTSEDFCLDVEGYKLQLGFEKIKARDLILIKEEPKKHKDTYDRANKKCGDIYELLKLIDVKIKEANRYISSLHIIEQVKEYEILDNNLRNSGEVFVKTQINQISIKRKKIYQGCNRYYSKIDGVWYRLYNGESKKHPVSSKELDGLLIVINKYITHKDVT